LTTQDLHRLTVVAHDVGGTGGMERHLQEVIEGLIERGFTVSVISRTLQLARHPNLVWHRVRGPARPFVIAYPWCFLAGGW
jgi:hypothetical protein